MRPKARRCPVSIASRLFSSAFRDQRQLGYRHGRTSLTWAITRLLLWKGDPDITAITYEDLTAFGEEISRWCALPEAPLIRASHVHSTRRIRDPAVLALLFEKQCRGRLHALHVLLFNTGQIPREPMHGLRSDVIWKQQPVPPGTPPAIAAPIDRWLSGRLQTTDRAESVRGARDAFRYLLTWLAGNHPEITSLTELTRDHIKAYLTHLHDRINPRNGRPLAARTRYGYISPLLIFFREASQWGWDDVSSRPLLGRSDLPKLSARLPRFIPRDELDRLMKAIEGLENPCQRTALLLVRWSGARKGEIRRLTLDCLDAYPDGYPRLRIPAGKTYTERMIPLPGDPLRHLGPAAGPLGVHAPRPADGQALPVRRAAGDRLPNRRAPRRPRTADRVRAQVPAHGRNTTRGRRGADPDHHLDWLKTNYFKTELEFGHCLRTPAEGPCECDLYLRYSKFFTTSEYAPRLRARLVREQQLIQDAVEHGWPREAERHTAISGRICELLAELGESAAPDTPGT